MLAFSSFRSAFSASRYIIGQSAVESSVNVILSKNSSEKEKRTKHEPRNILYAAHTKKTQNSLFGLFCVSHSLGSQSMPESSRIRRSRYFCMDFSGVDWAYFASCSFPSGDIQILTLAFVDWNFATAFRCASVAIYFTESVLKPPLLRLVLKL